MIRAIVIGLLALVLPISTLYACDADDNCGPGGTCIKREKRARGVCYGASPSVKEDTPAVKRAPESIETAVESSEMECIVTQDCPKGMECVIAGFGSACVKLN
jgi:hypothetical protein